jgi:ADP-ribose pyrophosphatase YjhB (NUDIX family)
MSVTTREYPSRPLVGIGIAVLRTAPDAVLLVRRARAPALGAWSLPGGAQKLGETAETAARRELLEETGLTVGHLHLAGHVDSIHIDADGRIRFHYTILDFCADWTGGAAMPGDDAAEIAWARLDRLPDYDLWDEAVRIIGLSRAILTTAR